jgi:cell division topological specificity factor
MSKVSPMPTSKEVARKRLMNVLKNDRTQLDQEMLSAVRSDVMRVLGNYMELDDKDFTISIVSTDQRDKPRLTLEAGVKKIHRSMVAKQKNG